MKYTIPLSKHRNGVADFTIKAYKTETPGLLAHHYLGNYPPSVPVPTKLWVVTHTKSGRAVAPSEFNRLKDAREYARRIGHLKDWTQEYEEITREDTRKALKFSLSHIYAEVIGEFD